MIDSIALQMPLVHVLNWRSYVVPDTQTKRDAQTTFCARDVQKKRGKLPFTPVVTQNLWATETGAVFWAV